MPGEVNEKGLPEGCGTAPADDEGAPGGPAGGANRGG